MLPDLLHISKLEFANVIPIFEKGSTDLLTNYRPISLLPSLSNVYERVIYNRPLSFFNATNAIVPTQYGFRHNRTTTHAIFDLIIACYDNISNSKFSALLFLDIKKTFDFISHHKFIKKLEFYGIRGAAKRYLTHT